MPFVIVSGLPEDTNRAKLASLKKRIKSIVAGVPELDVAEDKVTVRFPRDFLTDEHADLALVVEGLFIRPERSLAVKTTCTPTRSISPSRASSPAIRRTARRSAIPRPTSYNRAPPDIPVGRIAFTAGGRWRR
jgi:hypothetical protein